MRGAVLGAEGKKKWARLDYNVEKAKDVGLKHNDKDVDMETEKLQRTDPSTSDYISVSMKGVEAATKSSGVVK